MLPWRRPSAWLMLVVLLGFLSCHHVATARPAPAPAAGLHRHPDGGAAWRHSFKHLQDAGRGSRVAGLAELKRYLARFGYMHPTAEHDDAFDGHMEAAVKRYQSRLSLPVTGRLDAATLGRIASPRCGVGDGGGARVSVSLSDSAAGRFTFFDGKPRWTGPDQPLVLTYSISSAATVDYLPAEAVRAAIRGAFARWARVIPVEFVEAHGHSRHGANITVGFYEGDHGDEDPFDGQGSVLAHAYAYWPKDGWIHFDAAELWTVDMASETARWRAVDLESVATHEIGHVLGLDHSSSPAAIMYPSINFGQRKVELSVDDIDGVQLLYGSRHEQDAPAPPPPQSSDPSLSAGRSSSGWLSGSVSFACLVLVMLVTHR